MVNFDIKERQPREHIAAPQRTSMETPKAVKFDIEKNFQQKLLQLGSTVKERPESQGVAQLPETGLYREPYDIHTYDNQFQIESSMKKMMDEADRMAQEGAPNFPDQYLLADDMDILQSKKLRAEGLENQMDELINITPEKLNKFEAEFKGETLTKRKVEAREMQKQIDENLEAKIERVVEGYEKLGEMKLTIDKVLEKIVGEKPEIMTKEMLAEVDEDAKYLLDVIEGNAHDEESKFNS